MPHALLLSPDDQAVSAITGVLEEMSVTCERPLDGVSAAQKLNSQSFDLVLVDCENLPAAKLIFDVCRRGKNGNNPVPIAIVDGRAGLPTAFRLGAELILTKPVSKDQARTTIRSAVGRVRKDVPTSESVPAQPASADTSAAGIKEEHALAAAAGASTHLTSFADPVPASISSDASTATLSAPTLAPKMHSAIEVIDVAPSSSAPSASVSSKPKLPAIPSDDPVLADLERADAEESQIQGAGPVQATPARPATESEAPILSSHHGRQKPRGALVALLVLVLTAGGLYGAWMYQPGFRTLAQPQIDRVLALARKALPPTQSPSPSKPSAQAAPATAPVLAPAPTAEPVKTESAAPDSASASTPGSPARLPKTSPSEYATVQPPASQGTAAVPPAPVPTATAAPVVSKPEAVNSNVSKPAKLKKAAIAAAPPSDAPLPGENGAIILSSKGAEKRLAHSVPPKSPEGANGTVVLKEVVDENGNVTGVRLVEGNAALATTAMQAVKQWRYRPYVRDGKAQPFQTVVIIDFQRP